MRLGIEPSKEKRHLDMQVPGECKERAGAKPILAILIFSHLLLRDAEDDADLLLREPELIPQQRKPSADMPVDAIHFIWHPEGSNPRWGDHGASLDGVQRQAPPILTALARLAP